MYYKLRVFVRAVRIKLSHIIGLLTVAYRKTPDFLIIGAQKGGTSSLYFYLKFHPSIKRPIKKEIHYFNIHFAKGLKWYKAHFPLKFNKYITGEASPDYLFHPETPERVKALNPKIKLIVLLRDPIERAYSAFQMNRRMGIDPRKTFEEAIQFELDHQEEFATLYNYERHNYFYLERGLYAKQLQNWTNTFDKNQILVIGSKEFFINTNEALKKVYSFLNIKSKLPPTLRAMNVGKYPPIADATYNNLKNYFSKDAALLKTEWQIEFN